MYGDYADYMRRHERRPVCHCSVCGAELYEGDEIYEALDDEPVCEHCIEDYCCDKSFEIKEWFKDYCKMTL